MRGIGWCVAKVERFWVDVGFAGVYVYVSVLKTGKYQILIALHGHASCVWTNE